MSVKLFKSLLLKSAIIQEEIDREQRRRWPDSFRLLRLKKIRLSIKDRIVRLARIGLAAPGMPLRPQPVTVRIRGRGPMPRIVT